MRRASSINTGNGWKHERNLWAVHAGTQSSTKEAKDAVELSFQGNRVVWYGRMGNAMGKADVYVDGQRDQTVDTYDADEITNIALYSRTFPALADHKLKIVARGDHNWRSGDDWVVIDALQVGRDQVRVGEDTPGLGIEYSGGDWKHTLGWDRASGGTLSWAEQSGDAAEFKFEGAGITWVGKRCPACGKANVYLDGTLDAVIDTYAPDDHPFRLSLQGGWQEPIYQKTWPERGTHTLRLVVGDEKNLASTGQTLYIDSFQVTK